MSWGDETPENPAYPGGPEDERLGHTASETPQFSSDVEGPGEETSDDLLSEVNAVAHHLRELQKRLGSYRHRDEELTEGPVPESVPPPAPNGIGTRPEDASEHVAAIIAAAESAAAEIRARAEATAAEIVANAESAAARMREETRSEERRLFEAIDALRPAAAEFQHALERVHDAAVAALMSYPRA